MAYYSGWLSVVLPPENIDYSKFDIIYYAFVVPDDKYNLGFADDSPDVLKRLVECAHKHNTKVKASIGGWTGSAHFSSAVENDVKRNQFANNINAFLRSFNLDGIDIDWEYPGRQGNPGNEANCSDSANFLEFLRVLRSLLPQNAIISAAATTLPFAGEDGNPMADVSEFAKVLNWVLLMNYDTWGTTSNPGPNAPLHDACKNSTVPNSSAAAGFDAWTKANFPARQLVLGLPSYGYISKSTKTHLRVRSDEPLQPDSDDFTGSEYIKLKASEGGEQGSISIREMVKQGALLQDGHELKAVGGFTSEWDQCSCTPFLCSERTKQVVPYDNARSIRMKAAFVRRTNMRGVNFFDLQGDTDKYVLADAARRGLRWVE
ncbi:glycoside hydrolase family 18 protein [Marasmius fiardii PR-910]|nr:glycoside hydrolase family 18 protein [Marasmius fiardii PR-910]